VAYDGDRYMQCSYKTCRKKTKHLRCGWCRGKGGGQLTQCGACNDTGYKCENGTSDRYHY
jgi:hypothetical protein